MYVRRNVQWSVILRFAWSYLIVFAVWSLAVVFVHEGAEMADMNVAIPFAPISTIGVAVAFYVGFKNNQSYDRFWEARKIWGGIVNVSRSWTNATLSYVTGDEPRATATDSQLNAEQLEAEQRVLVYRHLAWINSLRYQLRLKKSFGLQVRGSAKKYQLPTCVEEIREILSTYLPKDELEPVSKSSNPATQILRRQGEHLRKLREDFGAIEYFRHTALMNMITECYTLQGKCERIKNTPLPRQYAYFSKVFTWIFITLLPFGLVGELGRFDPRLVWLTIPFSVTISWVFVTMEAVGDSSEDPFENFINDVPMTALCRTIEIDLREMLGETEIPKPIEPVDHILM